MHYQATIDFEDDVLFNLGMSPAEFGEEARLLVAAKLYDLGKLTSSQAAKLCGKDRVSFLLSLPRLGVSMINLRADDADDELSFGLAR